MLYKELEIRKDNGEKLNIKILTQDTLYQLWGEENYPDSCIASLFDVAKSTITNLRKKYDVNNTTRRMNLFCKLLGEIK